MAEIDHVGFTGSRRGMVDYQKHVVQLILAKRKLKFAVSCFHHGICVGSDEQSHKIALELGYKIYGHPPLDDTRQAIIPLSEFFDVACPFSFSGRNQRIAIASRIMIATPRQGSVGTFNALAHAERLRLPRIIIHENGITDFVDCNKKDML